MTELSNDWQASKTNKRKRLRVVRNNATLAQNAVDLVLHAVLEFLQKLFLKQTSKHVLATRMRIRTEQPTTLICSFIPVQVGLLTYNELLPDMDMRPHPAGERYHHLPTDFHMELSHSPELLPASLSAQLSASAM